MALLAVMLVSCTSRDATPSLAAASNHIAAKQIAYLRITIRVPKRRRSHRESRRAHYVSAATQSMSINVLQSGATVLSRTANLTATSSGCTPTSGSFQCTLTVPLAPGSYTASVSTYDGLNETGNELSSCQNVPFVVRLGVENTLTVTLNGIPHSLEFSGGSIAVRGTGASSLTIYGTRAQPVVVNALDADGDVIVGAGSPVYTGSVLDGTGWIAATPAPSSPDAIPITPPAVNKATAELQVTATYPDDTCSLPGAVCGGAVSLTADVQQLLVATSSFTSQIVTYSQPFSNASTPTSSLIVYDGAPNALGLDAAGNLYFATGQGAGVFVAPSFASTISFNANGSSESIAFDPSGDLFISNIEGNPVTGNVTVYLPQFGYSGQNPFATISTGLENPGRVVTDVAGHLFVANSNTVTEYEPPFTNMSAPIATISGASANVQDVATDALGDLFVAYYDGFAGSGAIAEYAPPIATASQPVAVITSGIFFPQGITFDAAGDLFVSNSQGGVINEFVPPFSGSSAPKVAISNDPNLVPLAMAVDGAGNLYVVNCYLTCQVQNPSNSIAIYAPPYTTGRTATITNGIHVPSALLLTP